MTEENDLLDDIKKTYFKNIDTIHALRAEVAALTAERAEAVEIHSRIMSEKCPPDEYHCTCVPALRAEVATLTAERDSEQRWAQQYHEAAAQFEIERDAARAEVERLHKQINDLSKVSQDYEDGLRAQRDTAEADAERLRAALEKIVAIGRVEDGEYNSVWDMLPAIKNIARAALEVK